VATPYEVTMRLQAGCPATALRDALARALPDTQPFTGAPTVEASADEAADLVVVARVTADDASTAQILVRDAVLGAVRDAGLAPDQVRVGDPEVRSGG